MISVDWVRMMMAHAVAMNRRTFTAASRLTDTQRRSDQGLMWRSLHGTLSHVLWTDRLWMWRFGCCDQPPGQFAGSDRLLADFTALALERTDTDEVLLAWAKGLEPEWLEGLQSWTGERDGSATTRIRSLIVTHWFVHQVHHRAEAHAVLLRFGQDAGTAELPLVAAPLGAYQHVRS